MDGCLLMPQLCSHHFSLFPIFMCSRTIDPFAVLSVDKELAIVPATPLSHAEGAEIQLALPHPSTTKVLLESLIGVFCCFSLCISSFVKMVCAIPALSSPKFTVVGVLVSLADQEARRSFGKQ